MMVNALNKQYFLKISMSLILLLFYYYSAQARSTIDHHPVAKKESLSKIAAKYYGHGKYSYFIARWNGLLSEKQKDNLAIGQKLTLINIYLIPKIYVAKEGEDLNLIAKKYNIYNEEIKVWNCNNKEENEKFIVKKNDQIIIGWRSPFISFFIRNTGWRLLAGFIIIIIEAFFFNRVFLFIDKHFATKIHNQIKNAFYAMCGAIVIITIQVVILGKSIESIPNIVRELLSKAHFW